MQSLTQRLRTDRTDRIPTHVEERERLRGRERAREPHDRRIVEQVARERTRGERAVGLEGLGERETASRGDAIVR